MVFQCFLRRGLRVKANCQQHVSHGYQKAKGPSQRLVPVFHLIWCGPSTMPAMKITHPHLMNIFGYCPLVLAHCWLIRPWPRASPPLQLSPMHVPLLWTRVTVTVRDHHLHSNANDPLVRLARSVWLTWISVVRKSFGRARKAILRHSFSCCSTPPSFMLLLQHTSFSYALFGIV